MSKERKAQILTVGILVIVFGVIAWQKAGWRLPVSSISDLIPARAVKTQPTPQDTIYGMLDAAREGNVKKYLAAYTGQMETSLKEAIAESTEAGFAKYLRDSNAPIKGIAITEPQVLTDREVKIRVEYVYQDRNEVQYMYLEKTNGAWQIARVDSTQRIKTLVPYGTPVE
jgi:hypothetical protein